ncbi:coiled-coil domain-containing protein 187 [Mantella aurantiaca]
MAAASDWIEFFAVTFDLSIKVPENTFSDDSAMCSFLRQAQEARISLTLKKDKGLLQCSSYRLTSLININLKPDANIFTYKLKPLILTLIYPEQVGFVPCLVIEIDKKKAAFDLHCLRFKPTSMGHAVSKETAAQRKAGQEQLLNCHVYCSFDLTTCECVAVVTVHCTNTPPNGKRLHFKAANLKTSACPFLYSRIMWSDEPAWDASSSPQYRHMQDVSQAWDSLMEAKHVLQRIENRANLKNRRQTRAQKIRRRLEMGRGVHSGSDILSKEISNPAYQEQEERFQRISEQTFTLYSEEPHEHSGNLTSTMNPPLVSTNGSSLMHYSEQAEPYVVDHDMFGKRIEKLSLSTQPQNTSEMEIYENFSNSRITTDEYVEEVLETTKMHPRIPYPADAEQVVNPYLTMTSPISAQHFQDEDSSLVAFTPPPSPKSDLYAQKLEFLKSKSPGSKLERLKERIREQKRRQEAASKNLTKSRQNPELARKVMTAQKIRKVTFGPPPPVYKGFSTSNKEATPVYPDESAVNTEKENVKKTDLKTQRTANLQALGYAKGKANCPVSRKLSFKSASPERKERSSGDDLYGASAWREGQKLVQRILGPSPLILRKRRVCENQEILQRESCRKRCQKMRCQDSLKEEHLQHRRDSSQSPDMLQVLRDIQAGKDGWMTPCRSLGEGDERLTNESMSRNVSPKRPGSRTDNHLDKDFGKENVQDGGNGQPNSGKTRSYSVQDVRRFMKRKIIERQKTERENQRKMQKAQITKREQISNILRKQKEAFPPKLVSAKMTTSKKNINTGDRVTAEVDNIGRDLSEWIHATSSVLLKEDHGSSGKEKKKPTEKPVHHDCTSPLRLRDLTATPTIHHQNLQGDVHSKEGLDPDNNPKVQSLYPDSKERVQAIWEAAKDLGRRVEVEMDRFGAIQLNSNVTPASSNSSPPRGGSRISKMAEQTDSNKLHRAKSSEFRESKEDCVPPLVSSNMDSAEIINANKVTAKMDKDQGYIVEKSAQTMKSQPKFKTRRAQKSCMTYQMASKRAQKIPELRSPKITQKKADVTKTTSPKYNDKKGKSATLHYGEFRPQVSNLRQTRAEITNKIKAQLEQQEKDLAVLRLKAETEAREAERCMLEMLRRDNLQDLPVKLRPKKMHPRDDEQQKFSNSLMISKPEGAVQRTGSKEVNDLPNENEISERSWDHTDSTSKWSEVSQFYGSTNVFSRFTLEMAQQYLREEELRARHQTALLRLREDALKEKTKAELALLKHQRMFWEMKKEGDKVEEILRQEEDIQKKLKHEQTEIRHLHNIYKAAHQERKLLLKQQKEILQIQQSAADIQQKLQCSVVQVSELSDRKVSGNHAGESTLRNPILPTEHLYQNTESAISDLSVDEDIMEVTQVEDKKWTQRSAGNPTMNGPDIPHTVPVLAEDNQPGRTQEQQMMIYSLPTKPDRGDESNPLSEKSRPVTGSLQSPLPNRRQEFLMSPEDLSNHSQEKRSSASEGDLPLNVGIQETPIVPEKDKRVNMDFQTHEMMTKSEKTDTQNQQRNLNVMTTDRETKEDTKLVSEIRSDSILKHSESNVPLKAQATATTLSSFAEFHKVSAKLINISESSVSVSDRGQDGQDTDSGDSEVFDAESTGFPTEGMFNVDEESVAQPFDQKCIGQSEEKNISSAFHNGKQCSSDGNPAEEPYNPSFSQKGTLNSRIVAALVMEETTTKKAPLASESFPTSEDVTESDSKTNSVEHLLENQDGTTVKVTGLQISTSMSPENISNVAGMSLSDTKDWTRMTEMNVKQSFTENVIFGKIDTAPFHATASKDLFQIKSFPQPSEGEVIFITDEVLQPTEDTLSEIFSPVDEKLSYGSGDLFSAKQDPSEELPSLPRDIDSIKSDEVDTEDFPTPPEEILFSGTESLHSSREASLIEEIHLLYDSLLTEEALVPTSEPVYELPNDGYLDAPPTEPEDQRNVHNVVGHRTPFLTLSKAEDEIDDPLFTFEIGDRVLVKLSKPGTLKFKGSMAFRDGYWAGVVLDKVEGDNDGTYKGIRYFDCPTKCGVFVRPGQISHLLFDDQTDSGSPGGDNNDSGEGPSPRNFSSQDQTGADEMSREQSANKKEQTSEKNISQTRSYCLKPSEASDENVPDNCSVYLNSVKSKLLVEDKDPGLYLQISPFCAVVTDEIILPSLLQEKRQTLILKVTDKLFNEVLSDVFETFAKVSQHKFNTDNINQHRKNTEESIEKCVVVHTKAHNKLQSFTTKRRETGGGVEHIAHRIVMETIKDCIEEYNKLIKKKGRENSWPTGNATISLQGPEIHDDIRKAMSLNKDKTSVIATFAESTIEEILTDSLNLMENIRRHKVDMSVSGTDLNYSRLLYPESSGNIFR